MVLGRPEGAPIDPRHDWDEWSEILRAAGLRHYAVHAARHTAAALLMEKRIALVVLQEMLGHSDIRVTRGYTHVASPLMHDAADRLAKTLFSAVKFRYLGDE